MILAAAELSPLRLRSEEDRLRRVPVHAVWEITLACNLKCIHCGSRAGVARQGELSTSEALVLIDQLAELGTRDITLIGGEAYLRPDWIQLIRAIRSAGMECSIQTGGRALTRKKIEEAAAAGLNSVGVSLDGLQEAHNRLRGVRNSYQSAVAALRALRDVGITTTVNSQINVISEPDLPELLLVIAELSVVAWQIQLTVAMGTAADNDNILLQPYQLIEIMPRLSRLYDDALDLGIRLIPGNNVGYFGPYEYKWRSISGRDAHWQSCVAGQTAIGIESDGTIKGCPSLPTRAYTGGNIRTNRLVDIWVREDELGVGHEGKVDHLWGYCRTCYYASVCRAGCTWTTHSMFGRPGNNPYCHHRVLDLASRGLRERVLKVENALGDPFDHGRFDLITETIEGEFVSRASAPPQDSTAPPPASSVPTLIVCEGCLQFTRADQERCHHCGVMLPEEAERQRKERLAGLVVELKARLERVEHLMSTVPTSLMSSAVTAVHDDRLAGDPGGVV